MSLRWLVLITEQLKGEDKCGADVNLVCGLLSGADQRIPVLGFHQRFQITRPVRLTRPLVGGCSKETTKKSNKIK